MADDLYMESELGVSGRAMEAVDAVLMLVSTHSVVLLNTQIECHWELWGLTWGLSALMVVTLSFQGAVMCLEGEPGS